MVCVVCNSTCDDSGLCDKHKYDEQLRKHYVTLEFSTAEFAKNFVEWLAGLDLEYVKVSETRILDDEGVPTEGDMYSPYCPKVPCNMCKGDSDVAHPIEKRKLTSWEWCQNANCCSATIDWERVFNRD